MVSEEALAFIETQEAWWAANPPQPIDVSPGAIGEYRRLHRSNYEKNCLEALNATGVEPVETELGGVRTLKVGSGEGGALLYFFGGAFIAGGPDEDVTITAPLAKQLNLPIFGPFYPLAPEHPFPAAVDTGIAVYRALLEDYSADQVAVVGESAGANLAVSVTLKAKELGLPAPACVVPISPAADLSLPGPRPNDPTMKPEERWDLAMLPYVAEAGFDHPLVSPKAAEYTGFPPTLITTGTLDYLYPDCVALHERMAAAGVEVTINVWDGLWHVFEHYFGLPEAAQSLKEIGEFIARHLDPTAQ